MKIKHLLLALLVTFFSVNAEIVTAGDAYNSALALLKNAKHSEDYRQAFKLLESERQKKHILATGLLSAIEKSCLINAATSSYCNFRPENIESDVGSAIYRLKAYPNNGEICLIVGMAHSGIAFEDMMNRENMDIQDWLDGNVRKQYSEAAKWFSYVKTKKYNRYKQSVNLDNAILELKAADLQGNELAKQLLDEIKNKYPDKKEYIDSKIIVWPTCSNKR